VKYHLQEMEIVCYYYWCSITDFSILFTRFQLGYRLRLHLHLP